MKSTCPYCASDNDSHNDRKNRFRVKDVFGFYIPFISNDISDFKSIICNKCGKEYTEKYLTLFGAPYRFRWVLPLVITALFIYMLYGT